MSMSIPILNEKQLIENLNASHNPFYNQYYAFYSSWFGGITKNPHLMLVPIDDHMVHRGDGVFEGIKAEARAVYLLDEHLDRLLSSAEKIALKPLLSREQMKTIILQTLHVADQENVFIRVYLSRGPGNFSVNPYDSVGSQFYVVITQLKAPTDQKYNQGVAIGKSTIPCKDPWVAQIKSCNYLYNVLMKKEAVDRNVEYVIGIDAEGFISEGFTENIMIVDHLGQLVHPNLNGILKGITMMRACELAREGGITVVERPIPLKELLSAHEIMMTGTSLDVLPVSRFENTPIKIGPIAKKLREWMRNDIKNGSRRSIF
jgi:branched-chain amino acid aminotransferase